MAEPVTTEELENALQEQAHKTAEWVFQNYVKAKPAMSFARMRDEMASDFIQAAREALANRKAGEWRPIAEAPTDREWTADLAFDAWSGPAIAYADDNPGEALFLVWYTQVSSRSAETTHWRPLPAPPLPLTDAGG